MNNFDFHNLLAPTEFETFCTHVLEIRENPIKFTTYRRGRDGGIDIKSTNTQEKIIGQCKLYIPQNERGLINNLKKELLKCKRLKLDRYIICVNINLSVSLSKEILELFKGYKRCEEDIIDGQKLNKYLEQPAYEYLFKIYSKLLVPNLKAVEIALEKVINRKFYNISRTFLLDLIDKHKLYHNTEQLQHLIQKLEEDKVIILSGNPGVGKTTTAKMIANYFINRKKSEVFYLGENDYAETTSVLENNRLIIVDDFWGQNFSPKIKDNSTYEREFVSLINNFKSFDNSYLILISREYILKDILKNAELETEHIVRDNKYIIQLKDYSKEDKVKIFLNHLIFYDFELAYLESLSYSDEFEHILNHKNYSPRILEIFIKRYKIEVYQSSYDFYDKLHKYLDNPIEYWTQAFKKLSPNAQLILLVLLITSDPMNSEDLRNSFNSVQEDARNYLNLKINPQEFETELKKLEEFYIFIEKDEFYNTFYIKFQSPGIKDYLLEYLRTDGYLWIKPIIKNAIFFNQLTFIFSTEKEKISDYESDIVLYGEKIVLNESLKKELKNKILTEFETLQFSNYEEREFSDQLTKFYTKNETKYLKLHTISRLLNIDILNNKDVKEFVLSQISKDFERFKINKGKIVEHHSMIYFPSIIKRFFPYLNFTKNEILTIFYESITFAIEYDYFYDFKEIFPIEFNYFYTSNILNIRKHIKELIEDDIDYYLWEDNDLELDTFTSFTIEELSKKYKFRLSTKYLKNLENTFDIKFPFKHKEKRKSKIKSKKTNKPSKTNKKLKPKPYQAIIEEYLPTEEDNYDSISYLKEKKYTNLISALKAGNNILVSFADNKILFENICEFIISKKIEINGLSTFEFIELYISYFTTEKGISRVHLTNFICDLYKHLEQSNHYSITKSKLKAIIKNTFGFELEIEILSPIITPYKQWYKLSTTNFEKYFIAKKLSTADNSEIYKKEILDYLMDSFDDIEILDFLQTADKSKLWNWFINPEIDRLLKTIDFTDDKSIALSFINFFQIEFELSWNRKERTLEIWSSSNSESHFENIFQFINIEFFISDFESYFEIGMQTNETHKRLFININSQKDIYSVLIKTIPSKTVNSWLNNEQETIFEIKLSDFITSSNNYQLLEDVGLVKYIKQILQNVKYARTANSSLAKW